MTQDEFNKLHGEVRQVLGKFKHECDIILAAKETAEQAYQRGLDDAWEAARKIVDAYSVGEGIRLAFDGTFWPYFNAVFQSLSPAEALAKIREYEEKKKAEDEAINVGDELVHCADSTVKAVITAVHYDGQFDGVCNGGGPNDLGEVFSYRSLVNWRKTGRHFPQIAEVLGEIANNK